MTRHPRRRWAFAGAVAAAALLVTASPAHADPDNGNPGTPPAGKTPSQLYTTVGADAFAELTNNLVNLYNAQPQPAPPAAERRTLASYDAVNPVTAVAGENITPKPGCTIARPNGANAALTAIRNNLTSTVDAAEYCIDWVRASRAKNPATEGALTFYAQSRDAVGYATIGNAYAPTTALTKQQLKDIFECSVSDWSEVGGQAGEIRVYLPASSAATLTFFLQALGTDYATVSTACAGTGRVYANQQNDGRSLDGDPQGIAPYAITKWAAQSNGAPGINDYRGGSTLGYIDTVVAPTSTTVLGGVTYRVLNPDFATANPSFSRLFFNAVRNDAPDELKGIFSTTGYLCTHQDALLIPFGNTPLGSNTSATNYCGQTS